MNEGGFLQSPPPLERVMRQRIFGAVVGIVTSNKDPDNLGRIKVRFPWLTDDDASHWARMAVPMAGKERGLYMLPEVDDEVLVMFEHGLIEYPYIIGALWNGKDKPPEENSDGKNNKRMLKSRSGHTIVLDDTDGKEKIIIRDKNGKNELIMDAKEGTLSITSEKDLNIKANGKLNISAESDAIAIKCKTFSVDASDSFEVKSSQKGALKAQSGLTIDCMAGVNVNSGALEVK